MSYSFNLLSLPVSSKSSFLEQYITQYMAEGLSCIVTIFSRKHKMFLNTVFPENSSSQVCLSTDPLQARKSQPNIMNEPTSPLHMMIIRFLLQFQVEYIFLELSKEFYLSWFNSQSSLLILKYPSILLKMLIPNKIPLIIIQSMMVQLQPRLQSVFYKELPSPREMKNQSKKLTTCRIAMPPLIHFNDRSSSQQSRQKTLRILMLIQIKKFLIVANMKNYSKMRQQMVSIRVCAIASWYRSLSYCDSLLLRSLAIALYPLQKSQNIPRLTRPSARRRMQTKPDWSQWKMVEQEVAGISLIQILQHQPQSIIILSHLNIYKRQANHYHMAYNLVHYRALTQNFARFVLNTFIIQGEWLQPAPGQVNSLQTSAKAQESLRAGDHWSFNMQQYYPFYPTCGLQILVLKRNLGGWKGNPSKQMLKKKMPSAQGVFSGPTKVPQQFNGLFGSSSSPTLQLGSGLLYRSSRLFSILFFVLLVI